MQPVYVWPICPHILTPPEQPAAGPLQKQNPEANPTTSKSSFHTLLRHVGVIHKTLGDASEMAKAAAGKPQNS